MIAYNGHSIVAAIREKKKAKTSMRYNDIASACQPRIPRRTLIVLVSTSAFESASASADQDIAESPIPVNLVTTDLTVCKLCHPISASKARSTSVREGEDTTSTNKPQSTSLCEGDCSTKLSAFDENDNASLLLYRCNPTFRLIVAFYFAPSKSEGEITATRRAFARTDPRNHVLYSAEGLLSCRERFTFQLIVAFASWQAVESNSKAQLIVEYSFALPEHEGDLAFVDSLLFTISTHDFHTRPNRGPPDKHQHDNHMPASEGDSVDAMSASEGDRTVEEYTKQEKTTRSSFINENARALRTEI